MADPNLVEWHPLVEMIADAIAAGLQADFSGEEIAQDIINKINATGKWWVAPWFLDIETMRGDDRETWAAMRDACLDERRYQARKEPGR